MRWSREWRASLTTCASITTSSFQRLRGSLTASVAPFSTETKRKSKIYSRNTSELRLATWIRGNRKKRKMRSNLKMWWVRTQISRLSRRSNSRPRCRFWKSAWRTWKPSTSWTRKSSTSTMTCSTSDNKSSRSRRRVSSLSWTRMRRGYVRKSFSSRISRLRPKIKTLYTPRNTNCSLMSSSSSKSALKSLKLPMTRGLRRFGPWTIRKPATSSRRSCTRTRSSICSSFRSNGSLRAINSSPSCLSQTPWLATPVTKVLTLPRKATLSWTRIRLSWTLRVEITLRLSQRVSSSTTKVLQRETRTLPAKNTSVWSKYSASWSCRRPIWSMTRPLSAAKA